MIDVTPAYLAGRSHSNQVFDRLTGEWAWTLATAGDADQDFAASPDQRFRIVAGQLDPGAWWRITAAEDPFGPPEWMAGFSTETPPEIVTAVVEELARTGPRIDRTGAQHPALQPPADRRTLIRTLREAGWRSVYRDGTLDLEAPDHLARVQIRLDPPGDPLDLMAHPHLYVEIGPRGTGGHPPYWQAMLTTHAPTVVADTLAHALTDPTPLRRNRDWMEDELLVQLGHAPQAVLERENPYTATDLRIATAESATGALEWVDYDPDEVLRQLVDQVIPSTRGHGATTWGSLPEPRQHAAAGLVLMLVHDAAERTGLLLGLPANNDMGTEVARRLAEELPALGVTRQDLYSAAAQVSTAQLHWADDPSGIGDAMDERIIASTAGHPHEKTWGALDPEDRERSTRAVQQLLAQAAHATALLFRPAPETTTDPGRPAVHDAVTRADAAARATAARTRSTLTPAAAVPALDPVPSSPPRPGIRRL
ncbi:hypothetical protein KNE206_53720 [Kitasatospora sp. NE20-6]|uniref:DUF317 domain-containing protein n=1 Tax=Kitasatospora sp. NE20-6 TaxID=2859066 RepID=UPI0034DBE29C